MVKTKHMLADAFKKPLADAVFSRLHNQIIGWGSATLPIPFINERVQGVTGPTDIQLAMLLSKGTPLVQHLSSSVIIFNSAKHCFSILRE